jgi:monovalent cation:H+ antiporter-2, CPA2 family
MAHLTQVLLLLGVAVGVVLAFQRLHIPTSLGYLLVGVILGPHTVGPVFDMPELRALAEFGVVFLLFTIGLNYSLPQLSSLRGQVLGLGTAQVVLTTALVTVLLALAGVPVPVAFVIGAVFAQSSSTIIASQLQEQGEESTPHGRLGLAMSVFQDVTAVPFLVIIPVLALPADPGQLAGALGWAMAKALLAFALLFFGGRWLLAPLLHQVTRRRSPEVFTLAVLLVVLMAAWTTSQLGLSLAFGAFLAGMVLGDTEFRHQVESTIRPFRDVLLGLFFVGIGMLFNPATIPGIWHWAVLGALLILASKLLLVTPMVRATGIDLRTAWRTGLVLAIGGEFGFALLAIALQAGVVDAQTGQIVLTAVLFSLIAGAALIRLNGPLTSRLARRPDGAEPIPKELPESDERLVVIAGYGRVGHTVAVLLKENAVPFMAFDTDPRRVAAGRADGLPVAFGDFSDLGLLTAVHVERASLVVITVDHSETALRVVTHLHRLCPHVPIIARARDLKMSGQLKAAGATHAFPEAIEASLRLAEAALKLLHVPEDSIDSAVQEVRDANYNPVAEDANG